jgi:hypothetical protein
MKKFIFALPVALLIGSGPVGQFSIQNASAEQPARILRQIILVKTFAIGVTPP